MRPSVRSICDSSGSTTTPAQVSPHATMYEQQPPVRISSKIISGPLAYPPAATPGGRDAPVLDSDVVRSGVRAACTLDRRAAPAPVDDLRHVVAVLGDVVLVLDQLVPDRLLRVRRPRPELRQPVDDIGD